MPLTYRPGRSRAARRCLISPRSIRRGPALIVIDLQNFFMVAGQPMANPHAIDIAPNVNSIAKTLRRTGGRVSPPNIPSLTPTRAMRLQPPANDRSEFVKDMHQLLTPGQDVYDLHSDLDVTAQHILITKRRASAFHPYAQTDLKQTGSKWDRYAHQKQVSTEGYSAP